MIIQWNENFNINIKEVDEQHQKLVGLLNKLFDAMSVGKGKVVLSEVLSELIEYTKYHFSTEEKYMVKYKYPAYNLHKLEHTKLTEQVLNFQKDFNENKVNISVELMSFLKDWLINHINGEDKKFGTFFNKTAKNKT